MIVVFRPPLENRMGIWGSTMMRTIYSKIDSRKPYQKSQIWRGPPQGPHKV